MDSCPQAGKFNGLTKMLGGRGNRADAARLAQPPDDAPLVQIVRGHLHLDAVANGQTHPAFAHLATNSGEHEVFVGEFNPEHRAWKHGLDAPFYFNMFFFHVLLRRWPDLRVAATSHGPANRTRPDKKARPS